MNIDKDVVPSTIEQAVEHVCKALEEQDREYILDVGPNCANSVHHTIGRYIRNSWSLWQDDTPLKRDAVSNYSIAHPDDISGLILEWVVHQVKGLLFDPQAHCERYHKHWNQFGMTSLEAGGWKGWEDDA